ncbi:uncharacterized protein LOC103510100 isoform X2 [Diaphorina citri]|uniref:Uncharacterized protein LOC103510100 isoform X2 n=1 Tax=Diaphorina citri TaxID=121845 RepID=A0A1S3D2G8_DIACI|nr:uncharacterized protein LOC103510100 isoform X2 [Diaphorina citri]KAI5713900.1 hypothetical protein M8J76_007441 [Diaphorina citri]KAI5715724.1 hypothetical protein M8J77_021520 [Diaphorina citri]
MPQLQATDCLAFFGCLVDRFISALYETMATFIRCLLYRNRLLCWIQLVLQIIIEVVATLIMAGVTFCLCTYFILTDSEDEDCAVKADVCEMLRNTDIRAILARQSCDDCFGQHRLDSCPAECFGIHRFQYLGSGDLGKVFEDVDRSSLLEEEEEEEEEDMYCFEKYGKGHDSLHRGPSDGHHHHPRQSCQSKKVTFSNTQ